MRGDREIALNAAKQIQGSQAFLSNELKSEQAIVSGSLEGGSPMHQMNSKATENLCWLQSKRINQILPLPVRG